MRLDKNGYYTRREREAICNILYSKNANWEVIPFNLWPAGKRDYKIKKLKAAYPTWCWHCNKVDEVDFEEIGVKTCQHCRKQIGFVPISNLPSIEAIKAHCNTQIDESSWIAAWRSYLKTRNQK